MRQRQKPLLLRGCLLLLGTGVLPSMAQQPPSAEAPRPGTYLPGYFADVAPANAYDMVLRLPGFTLVDADPEVRGYSGASGNVLFDGARPTSKRESLAGMLKRIPAKAVDHIELIQAGTPGVDMGGHAVLANVVRRHEASTEIAIESGLAGSTDGWGAPLLKVEYGRRREKRALDLALASEPEMDDDSGRGSIVETDLGSGGSVSSGWRTRATKRKDEASASWRQPLGSGRLTLTGAVRGEDTDSSGRVGEGIGAETNRESESTRENELGARYVIQLGGHSTVELMASRQRATVDNVETSREGDDDERFVEQGHDGESIVRLAFTRSIGDSLALDAGIEGADNFLARDNRLFENGQSVEIPGSRARIDERRIEASAGLAWQPHPEWTIEAGMRLEKSRISQTGDQAMERHFTYPKPRAVVRWSPDDVSRWRLSLSREVGQLDFSEFAASASLAQGTVSAGNARLKPDNSWQAGFSWERRFGDDAALALGWTHDRISDAVDRVLVREGDDLFDAPGNIGDGRRDTLSLELSTPLPVLDAARIRTSLLWRRSRVTDPITGEQRGISKEKPFEGEVEFSQELASRRLSWGLLLEHLAERKTKYRHDRVTRESEDAGWTLFAEQRLGENWRLRAEATDLFGRRFLEQRWNYADTRADGPVTDIEQRRRVTPGTITLTLRRSVGG